MLKAWLRDLEVILTSKTEDNKRLSQVVFGDKWKKGEDDVDIHISGSKYLSPLKDAFTIEISNLSYNEIVFLTANKYFNAEIKAGYRTTGAKSIFKGEVMFISNELSPDKTHKAIILCGSSLVARFGQSKMNLSLNSGINMYSAIQFFAKRSGIRNPQIDESLKNLKLNQQTTSSSSFQNWLNVFCDKNMLIANTDETGGSTFSVYNPYKTNPRVIKLNSDTLILNGGYPRLSSDGLQMSAMPTFNFIPGDVIQLDNSIIDISAKSTRDFTNSMWFNDEGKYMIFELNYSLSNRADDFTVGIKARNRSIYTKLIQEKRVEGY